MSNWASAVEAVASGAGVSVTILVIGRRAFRKAVQDIVDRSQADLIRRQGEFEHRQGEHLNRQDVRLERIERKLNHVQRPRP